ncbi:MAG TPA: LuxR C-terminal-related transcriptional regulator [Nitrospirota bacterium]|nr:LuxR C-terminal-related transcriptional regulator [Nitrospirota bacterium]
MKFHLKNIYHKLNTTNRSHAIAVALGNKLIDF